MFLNFFPCVYIKMTTAYLLMKFIFKNVTIIIKVLKPDSQVLLSFPGSEGEDAPQHGQRNDRGVCRPRRVRGPGVNCGDLC